MSELCCYNSVNIGLLYIAELMSDVFWHNSVIVLKCSTAYTLIKLWVSLQLSNV